MRRVHYFSGIDWFFLKQRPQYLTEYLSDDYEIYFYEVESMIASVSKQRNSWFTISKVEKNICIVKIHYLIQGYTKFDTLNFIGSFYIDFILRKLIKEKCSDLFIIGTPIFARISKKYKVIYDCVDSYSDFRDAKKKFIISCENLLVRNSFFVVVTAKKLFDKFSSLRDDVVLISNGVDFGNYSSFFKKCVTKDIKCGFVGAIYDWIDLELIKNVAKMRPDVLFEMYGPIRVDMIDTTLKNLTFFGEIDYTQVPQVIANMDICLIPFKINELTENANPIKLYEYFSLEKPVISTKINDLLTFSETIYFIDDENDFSKAIDLIIKYDNDAKKQKRLEIAKGNSWETKAREYKRLFEEI